jgi:thiosulfate reductase cytochrome b subunit
MFVGSVVTDPEFRNRGFQRTLFNSAEEVAERLGIDVIVLWSNQLEFYQKLGLSGQLALGLGIHFFFMWFFALNGLVYVGYLLFSGEWKQMIPLASSFRDAFLVTLYDMGLRNKLPPQGKFNGGQRIAYTGVAFLGLFQILTGLAIYKPVQLQSLLSLFGGYETARLIHFIVTIMFVLFFLVHLFQVVRAGWNNFRSMVTGTEEITDDEIHQAQGIHR